MATASIVHQSPRTLVAQTGLALVCLAILSTVLWSFHDDRHPGRSPDGHAEEEEVSP